MTKIYKLAEQAAEYAVLNPSDEILQSETKDLKVEIPKAFIDQFARLLLVECMELTKDCKTTGGIMALGGDEIILDYFGIEEDA